MATSCSSNDTRNFQCVTVASVDVIKLPLRDILASRIKPVDLYQKIQSCSNLKLRPDQLKICLIPPPNDPDYNKFDVTLLYTLIRNLCSLPRPAQGWGNEPTANDTQISDDIERLRLFRNNYYAHAESAVISDVEFEDVWKNLKSVFKRIQPKTGFNVDYEEELIKIERSKFTDYQLDTCRILLDAFANMQKQTESRDEPDIFIKGENEIICGGIAQFEADVKKVESSCWSIAWQKRRGDVIKCIDTSMERYSGSTNLKLVIRSLCKEDEGEYQAVLSLDSNGPDYKSRNTIRLHVIGEMPFLNILEVTTGYEVITIHYNYGVPDQSPKVHHIEWTKNGQPVDNNNKKYVGGGVHDSCFTIESPTYEDRGNYSCKVINAVGTVAKNIMLDVPHVEILVDSPVSFESETTIKSVISSTPTPEKIEWQKSKDGINFHCIENAYTSENTKFSTSPFLKINKATFADKLYYRLLVWNRIGESVSNTIFLNVTGSPPNITTSFESNIKNRSVTLIGNLYFLDNSPDVLETFWTKNDERINTRGSGGKLLEMSINYPALIIRNVSTDDAGEYRLTAINAIGSSTSDVIVLGVPSVFVEKIEDNENGSQRITLTIRSLPAPCYIQWSAKNIDDACFTPIDTNADECKGTTVTFPHPVLVVRQRDQLEKNCFQIEVTNFIGKTSYELSGNINPVVPRHSEIVENTLYKDHGASVRFIKFNNILAKQFPLQKLEDLKFSLINSNKIKNRKSVLEAKTTLECLRILQDENLFTQADVIFMQFLCRETECLDLFEKCIEYAEKQRALCYFEKKSVNGYLDVQFHVQGEISGYTKEYIQDVIETVAAILDCNEEDILLNGVRHSTSFLLSLSVKEIYSWKLLVLNEEDCKRLRRLNIDYLIIDKNTIDLEGLKDSAFTMDPEYSLEDVVQCDFCETPGPPLHCDICEVNLCKACTGKHLFDESKKHVMGPFKLKRRATKCISKCPKHTTENYINAMEDCDHECVDVMNKLQIKKHTLQRELQELEKSIYPKYQEIASSIPIQKDDLNKNSQKITKAVDKHGEDLHRNIDNVIMKLKFDINETDLRCLSVLNKQEEELNRTISEITQNIAELKKLLDSNDVNFVSAYNSRISEFRRLPPKLAVTLPKFTPQPINEEQIYQQFGSLSGLSIQTEENSYTTESPSAESFTTNKPLIDVPRVITDINTGYNYGLHTVTCLTDEHIWTYGYQDNIMKLYNLQGELVKSIETKSGNRPLDIAVTRSGNLVYTDFDDKTVNIVKSTQIKTVITLHDWSPRGVCSTSAGDLLVAMVNNECKQTKIVRYSGSTYKQTIQYNDKGTPLYSSGHYVKFINENKNLDICVSDCGASAVVVVNQAGKLRFTYTGPPSTTKGSFNPRGITTDSQGRILTADFTNDFIHIIDKDGQFLRYIDNCHLQSPRGICVDTRDNLFVADCFTGRIKKIQYCI